MIDRNADRAPDREAVVFGATRRTNRDLQHRVNALAAFLREVGVGPGQVVAILAFNCIEYLETTLAINKVGAAFLPLNFRLALPEWHYIIDHSQATAIVAEETFAVQIEAIAPQLPRLRTKICIGEGVGKWLRFSDGVERHAGVEVPTMEVGLDDLQRLMYTSGTTSRPKGVALSHGNVLWKTHGHVVEFGLTAADRTLIAGPMYHVGGFDLPGTGTLYVGGSLVILRKFEPRAVMEAIAAERPTNVWLAPSMLNALMELPDLMEFDANSIRLILNGGEKMPLALIDRVLAAFPNAWFADAYGLTETVSGDTFLDRDHTRTKIGSVGKPVVHLDLKIQRDDLSTAGPNESGEVLLRGPKVFRAYWRDERATKEAFRDGWFCTGDIGRIDSEGYLYIEDRKKDMIVSGGENIASTEIERVLYSHPAVLEAAVVGRPADRWGEVPVAFVVLRPGLAVSAQELITLCTGQLAKFKVPKAIEFTEALPRNPSGKVLKRELRERSIADRPGLPPD
jgi:acyl-CoA synthetase (AMP-forming)/AMP-acid ligase II